MDAPLTAWTSIENNGDGLWSRTIHQERGIGWLGWRPRLYEDWRLWRSGDRPIEFEGLALTPRFNWLDELPSQHELDQLRTRFDAGEKANIPWGLFLNWPEYGLELTCQELTVRPHSDEDGFLADVLVVQTVSDKFVLGWTEEAPGQPSPPAEEVLDPSDSGRPWEEGQPLGFWDYRAQRYRAEVFDDPDALLRFVGHGSGVSIAAVPLVRWAVAIAGEFQEALRAPVRAERI